MISDMDKILQTVTPTIMVPKFSQHEPLNESGHRFLATSAGLWLEVKRPWLHFVWPLCEQSKVAMPYGELGKIMQFSFDCIPQEMIQQFIQDAQEVCPIECATWLIWNEKTGKLEYRKLQTIKGTRTFLELERPVLESHEHLAVDIHSHGTGRASFSPEDNKDDAGEVKISVVVGNVNTDKISIKTRLCALDLFIPL